MTGTISSAGAVAIAVGNAVAYVSLAIALAATWHFPIPFGYILLVGPFVILFWVFAIAVIGPHLIIESVVIRQQIKALLLVITAQGIVAVSYPVFTAIFYRLSEVEQTFFIMVMPLIKLVTKQIIAHATESLHAYVGPVVVFSVDVFNVFYLAICMQISKSTLTAVLMVASDSFHVFIALRSIFRQAVVKDGSSHKAGIQNYLRDLPDKVWNVFEDQQLANICGCRIRVIAPFPLPLSNESIAFMNRIARTRRDTHIYSSSQLKTSRRSTIGSTISSITQPLKQTQGSPATHTQKLNSESRNLEKIVSRRVSSARKILAVVRLSSRTSTDTVLRTISIQKAAEKAVWGALQGLLHAEYLLLAEYIECALPLLYAAYLSVIFHLPVAPWYPQTAFLDHDNLMATVSYLP
ncbi:hypothetical protein PHYSODRAFT_484553 [Phytophthora sojae]|uniref:Uncharacterized protein n=1 Tax=Phytophthora sojae (strain P6497) TaxID=1094619 RepID=G4YTT4_PHYSP|nr:hypothetical protein PHYSODRAFT_484553 [Phytophthora sojae]EGZ26487.1 hypothetical protein PHYSODRAFT_484553 [Phytophthora sojae]|eukprot:XP_009521775.1 hypothetical protein PHYSODRAFT_484553 [Phytophthora sojae]